MTNYSQGSSSRSKSCSPTQWLRQFAAIRSIRRTDVILTTTDSTDFTDRLAYARDLHL